MLTKLFPGNCDFNPEGFCYWDTQTNGNIEFEQTRAINTSRGMIFDHFKSQLGKKKSSDRLIS